MITKKPASVNKPAQSQATTVYGGNKSSRASVSPPPPRKGPDKNEEGF